MRKCECIRFENAIKNYEIKKIVLPTDAVRYFLCVVEGIESRIYYCCWCGGEL